MKLRSGEYRDPGLVLLDVMRRHQFAAGDVVLALVRDPAGDQAVVHLTRLDPERCRDLDDSDRSRLLAEVARKMPVPDWRPGEPPEHSIVTIVARRGWCLIGGPDAAWTVAWLYSHHLTHAYTGDLIVVTEHGWTDFMTGWGGHEPRLEAAAQGHGDIVGYRGGPADE